jgi:hypothetical protein
VSEVGALIVRLQAETAQFRSDMGKVKSDLDDLKDKAAGAGGGVSSAFESAGGHAGGLRNQIGLLDNAIRGAHAQAMADLIRRYSETAIVMNLLPIAATGAAFVVMAGLAVEGVRKIIEVMNGAREATEKTHAAQNQLAGTISSVGTDLRDKFLEAGIQADDLNGNHLAAVKKQLELIDNQSMKELEQTFETLAGVAGKTFDQLKAHWYEFGSGSDGARHSLETFQSQYEMMLKTGSDKGAAANKFLDDKLAREKSILGLQQQASNLESKQGTYSDEAWANTLAYTAANNKLKEMGVGFSAKEIQAEQDLVQILQAQVDARKQIEQTAGVKKHNVTQKADNSGLEEEAAYQKIVAEGIGQHEQALIRLQRTQKETEFAANKGGEDQTDGGQLAAQKAAVEAEKNFDIAAAKAALAAKENSYQSDLKAAGQNAAKKKELNAQWVNEQRASADAVVQITAEAKKQITALDREAANQSAAAARAAAQQGYDDILRMAISAAQRREKLEEESAKNLEALHRRTDAETLASQIQAVNNETNAEVSAYNQRIKNLDKYATDYEKKYKELQDKIKQLEQQGDDQVTRLKQEALQKQVLTVTQAENRMEEAIATDIAHSIVMNKSLAQAFRQTGEQMAEQAIKNVIMMELSGDKQKLIAAKLAYHQAFAAMAGVPPAPIWGYAAGAAAFAGVMSFETGGKIPGNATGAAGAVPIIGHQGETVITKSLTDRAERAEAWGGNKAGANHNWSFSPTVHAMDAEGVDRVLTKHNNLFQRHVASTMRKMNR